MTNAQAALIAAVVWRGEQIDDSMDTTHQVVMLRTAQMLLSWLNNGFFAAEQDLLEQELEDEKRDDGTS